VPVGSRRFAWEVKEMIGTLARIREKWDLFLSRLARANLESFGNRRLDCCDLNKRLEVDGGRNQKALAEKDKEEVRDEE
jgi:hypothetical protein